MKMPSNRQIRQILAVVIVAASVAILGTIVVKNFTSETPELPASKKSPEVDMSMSKLRFSEMRDDSKQWELVAEKADYDKDSGKVKLSGLRLETFENKTGGVIVTSRYGNYLESERLVKMQEKVHAVTRKGMVFDTEYVEYRAASGVIKTDRPVRVADGRLTLRATGMELSLNDEKVSFLSQIDATVEGKK